MFDKLLDLFRGQVKVAAIEGAEAGLDESGHADRVKCECRQAALAGIQEALDEMSDMLIAAPKAATRNGKRPHATKK